MEVLTFDCILGGSIFSIIHSKSIVHSGLSALFVFFVLLLIVQSLLFTLSVLLLLILSFTIAFFLYTVITHSRLSSLQSIYQTVFGLPFFPFVNLISLALMIYLAADDALLLVVFYRHERKARPHRMVQSNTHSCYTFSM